MLEIGILSVILLAAGYWAAMFFMGRRDDVIHGKFVHAEEAAALAPPAMPTPPPFPKRPVGIAKIKLDQPKPDQPTAANVPAASVPPVAMQPPKPEAKPVSSDALQSLLAAIQQDLKSVA